MTDRPTIHTKTAHFLPADIKTINFENETLNRRFLETASCGHSKMMKIEHFSTVLNAFIETDRFLAFRYISLAPKSCNDFFAIKYPTVFKLLRHRVNANSDFATVTVFSVVKVCRHRVNVV